MSARTRSRDSLARDFRDHAIWLKQRLQHRLLGGSPEADDIVQETYLRFGRYRQDARGRHPRALLWRIAHNLVRDEARRLGRHGGVAVTFDALEATHDPRLTFTADQPETVLLKQLIVALPARVREVFMLARFSAMTHAEIARHLGISVKTVEWRMGQALALCAARLREDDG